MENETTYFWLLVTLAFVATILGSYFVRRNQRLILRQIPGFQMLPLAIDESIESDRPIHLSSGATSVGQTSTLAAMAASTMIYRLVERQAFTQRLPMITLSDPVTLAIMQDTLRKAYLARQNIEVFRTSTVSWYPQGVRSVAFGAGVVSLTKDRDVLSHILLGEFGAEMAFFGDATIRAGQQLTGLSTELEGQAIAYAHAHNQLIGEELFVGGAYLEPDNALYAGGVVALDILRWTVIVAIIVAAIIASA